MLGTDFCSITLWNLKVISLVSPEARWLGGSVDDTLHILVLLQKHSKHEYVGAALWRVAPGLQGSCGECIVPNTCTAAFFSHSRVVHQTKWILMAANEAANEVGIYRQQHRYVGCWGEVLLGSVHPKRFIRFV